MKIIYMHETLVMMQDLATDKNDFMQFIKSGEFKRLEDRPYLVITN